MEHTPICPKCLSRFVTIHGLIYTNGNLVGERCEDVFHRGPDYDPDRWVLSAQDEEFLSTQHISLR